MRRPIAPKVLRPSWRNGRQSSKAIPEGRQVANSSGRTRGAGVPMRRLNAAIVGCGWVADWHTRDGLVHIPDCYSIVACCDTNAVKAKEFADRYGIANVLTRYEDLLRLPDVDVVAI